MVKDGLLSVGSIRPSELSCICRMASVVCCICCAVVWPPPGGSARLRLPPPAGAGETGVEMAPVCCIICWAWTMSPCACMRGSGEPAGGSGAAPWVAAGRLCMAC